MRRFFFALAILLFNVGIALSDHDNQGKRPIDGFGDVLPPGALLRLGTVRFRHGYTIESMSLAPDGKRLVTCSRSGLSSVRLWDAHTGRELRRLDAGNTVNDAVSAVAFSPKEDVLAAAAGFGDGSVVLLDGTTGKKLRRLGGVKEKAITDLAFSHDGKLLAAAYQDDTVCVWDLAAGTSLTQFHKHKSGVLRLAFSPDGKILATAGFDFAKTYFVRLWDVASGKELRQLHGHANAINAIAFSPDGKHLASGARWPDGTMRLWDVETGQLVHEFKGHDTNHGVRALAFSADGAILASGSEVIRLWDVAGRKEIRRLPQIARRLIFTGDGRTLFAAGEGAVHRWDVANGRDIDPYSGHDASLGQVVCSPDGRLTATRDHEGGVRIWETATGKELHRLRVYYYCDVAFSADGKLFAAVVDDKPAAGLRIRLWNVAPWKELATLPAFKGDIGKLCFLPDGNTLVTCDNAGTVRLWDRTANKEIRQFRASTATKPGSTWITAAALSPDGKRLAVGEQLREFRTGLGGSAALLSVWDVGTGRKLYQVQGHRHQVSGLTFSPDGQILASCGGGSNDLIRRWDAGTGRSLRQLPASARNVVFSPDGALLGCVDHDDRTIRVLEVATGQERCRFQGHTSHVFGLAFTPDGRSLLSASADTTAVVWDLTGLRTDVGMPALKLTPGEQDDHWAVLAGTNAAKSHKAVWTLAADPRTPAFLKPRLQPVPTADERRIDQSIRDLDSANFTVREKATRAMEAWEEVAEPSLRRALKEAPVVETQRRLQRLLERLEHFEPSGDALRRYRALEVLERHGTPEAMDVLQILADGDPHARLTRTARAALERLERLRAGK